MYWYTVVSTLQVDRDWLESPGIIPRSWLDRTIKTIRQIATDSKNLQFFYQLWLHRVISWNRVRNSEFV